MKQLNLAGQTKEEEAIKFIQKHEPPEGWFLGFSGGKDSIVLDNLTIKASVKYHPYYSDTGIDPPELVRFIKEHYPNVKFLKPNWHGHRSFFGMIPGKGFPTKFARWC